MRLPAILSFPRLARLQLVAAATVLIVAVALLFAGLGRLPRQQREAARWATHSMEVIAHASMLQADLATMAAEGRGFFMDRLADSRGRFTVAATKARADVAVLRSLVVDNAEQTAALDRLDPQVQRRTEHLAAVMDRFAADDVAGGMAMIRLQRGRALMDAAWAEIEGIKAEERRLLGRRDKLSRSAEQRTVWGLLGAAGLVSCSALLAASVLLNRRRDRLHMTELRGLNAALEERVAARTQELALSDARQRGYFAHSPVGIMVGALGPDDRLTMEEINPAAERMYALTRDKVLGRTAAEIWPPALAAEIDARLRRCIATGNTVPYMAARAPRGVTRHLDIVVAPLQDIAGVRRVIVCARDVTEERALEQQVLDAAARQAEAAERELALFRNSADILVILRVEDGPDGPDLFYELISPALETLTGLRVADMLGLRPQDCLEPEVAAAILPRYRRAVLEQEKVVYSQTYSFPIGVRDYEGSITPIVNPGNGRVIRLAASLRDVTERNRMQLALSHGQKMEAVGRLAAGVAHDFNNILQSVVGGLELVLDEVSADTPARQFAGLALGAAQRGADLTHHLLSYARKQVLRPRAVDLATFLPEMASLLARTLGPHIAVDVRVDGGLPPLHADPGQLETALLNLCINAAHAMPKGGALSLRARLCLAGSAAAAAAAAAAGAAAAEAVGAGAAVGAGGAADGYVLLSVTDTGRGMDPQTAAQAFEPFFTTKGLDGTGLGLSMVQGFAEQSGGTVRLDTAPGLGTTVELRLPAAVPASAEPATPAAPPGSFGGARVLLVDDVDDVLLTTEAMLEAAGFAVRTARHGNEAIALLADGERFDALLTDYAMPGMNGSELIAQARCFQPGLPALMVTGYAEIREEERGDGPSVVLNKPFSRESLLTALRDALGAGADPSAGPGTQPFTAEAAAGLTLAAAQP